MRELPFVGAEREALVARLLAAYDEVVASGSPRLVTLEAGSGWGKSRVVREMYGRMAAERQTSGFWPATILDAVAEADRAALDSPSGRRKRVFPASFTAPAGALPEWLWWGISATARQGGTPVNALAADLDQVERLRAALLMRMAELNPDTVWGRAVRALRSEDAREVAWEVAEKGLEAVLTTAAISSGPLGFLVLSGRMVWKHRGRLGQLAGLSEPDGVGQTDVRGEMVRTTAESLGRFAVSGVPVVLVLEDAHQADETLVDLLVAVLNNRQGPVLIVATAWPGTLDEEGRQAHRLLSEVPGPARERILPADLPELDEADRAGLVGELLPHTDAVQRRMLATKWSNPLVLELGCRLRAIEQMLEDGELTEAELAALPVDVEGIHRAMWQELPEGLRQALMLAVLATPATVSGELFADRRWVVDLPAAAAARLDWLRDEAQALRSRLVEDATVYDWVRRVDEWLQACHEPAHHQVAAEAALDPAAYSPSRRRAYYQALADSIALDDAGEAFDERQQAQARLLVSLAVEGFIDWSDAAVASADRLVAELGRAADTASLRTLVAIADAVPERSDEAGLERRGSAAEALGRLGQLDTATVRFMAVLDESIQVLGADDPATLTTRNDFAFLLGQSGRVGEAVEQFTALLEDQVRVLGPDHPATLRTRGNLAGWLGESGRVGEAVERFAELLTDQVRVLGSDHMETLANRNNLASLLGRSGRVGEAVEQSTALLVDCIRALGRDHSDTLAVRHEHARLLGESGRVEEALEQFRELLADRERLLGRDHPHTLRTRGNVMFLLGQSGRIDEAANQVGGLLADCIRVLGHDHPDTLTTRHAQADLLGASGRPGEAVKRFTELLVDRVRVMGSDHPDTLTTRSNLAWWLWESGRPEEAVEQFAELLVDQVRVMGSDHPDTLRVRGNLASRLGKSGRPGEAVEQFAELLVDQVRVLGPEHSETLDTCINLLRCLGELRTADGADGEASRLLKDCWEALGDDRSQVGRLVDLLVEWSRRRGEVAS